MALLLPESRSFPRDFVGSCHRHAGERRSGFRRKIIPGGGEHSQGQGADAIVCGAGLRHSAFRVSNSHVFVSGCDLRNQAFVMDHVRGQRLGKAVGNSVHPTYGLKHRRLPVNFIVVELALG